MKSQTRLAARSRASWPFSSPSRHGTACVCFMGLGSEATWTAEMTCVSLRIAQVPPQRAGTTRQRGRFAGRQGEAAGGRRGYPLGWVRCSHPHGTLCISCWRCGSHSKTSREEREHSLNDSSSPHSSRTFHTPTSGGAREA